MALSASKGGKLRLGELLVRAGAISEEQLQNALAEQQKWGGKLGRVLVDFGFLSDTTMMEAVARQLGIACVDPASEALSDEVVKSVPVQVCERYGVIAVAGELERRIIHLASADPTNVRDFEEIAQIIGFRIEPVAATLASIEQAIRRHYYGEGAGAAHVKELQAPAGFTPSTVRRFAPEVEAPHWSAPPGPAHHAEPTAGPTLLFPPQLPAAAAPQWPAPPPAFAAGAPVLVAAAALQQPAPGAGDGAEGALAAISRRLERLERGAAQLATAPQLAAIAERLSRAEAAIVPAPAVAQLARRLGELEKTPPGAGAGLAEILERLDRLEHFASTELSVLRSVVELLTEKQLITREEYFDKMRKAR